MQHVRSGVALCWGLRRIRLAFRAATARDAGRADELKRRSPTPGNRRFPDSFNIVGRCDVCFAAVTAKFVKSPAEKSLFCHVQFIRELFYQGTLEAMGWIDHVACRPMVSPRVHLSALPCAS